jgi:hypothetical protein
LDLKMAKNGNDKAGEIVTAEALVVTPYRSRARLRLSTVHECTREMARIYREARNNQIDTQTATRLCYILQSLAGMIRDSDLERRIEALEQLRQ